MYLPPILCVFLLLCPVDSRAEKNYRVVVFGDSITSGYQLQAQDTFAARLETKLRAAGYDRLEVINMGKANATTASATAETNAVIQKLPDVVIVQLGFNDTKRGVLASAIANNLNTIIADLARSNAYIVLVGVPAPRGADETYASDVTNYFYSVAAARKVSLYPSALEGIGDNPELTMADGSHPNTAGVEVMVNGILPLVDEGLRWRYEIYQQEMEQAQKVQRAAPPVLP